MAERLESVSISTGYLPEAKPQLGIGSTGCRNREQLSKQHSVATESASKADTHDYRIGDGWLWEISTTAMIAFNGTFSAIPMG